ncbi:MAG: hypothetical protein Ct9H300mP4_13720 [Gammaproteobacteria bacterium]|nr:MAG: hypothetical protein Ct9H300mP4_13720 [Gammaproteobacteria bacterium]
MQIALKDIEPIFELSVPVCEKPPLRGAEVSIPDVVPFGLCWVSFSQIAGRWNQLIPDFLNYLTPGPPSEPEAGVERFGEDNHQRNSLIQMIARMKK